MVMVVTTLLFRCALIIILGFSQLYIPQWKDIVINSTCHEILTGKIRKVCEI